MIEIESLAELDRALAEARALGGSMSGWQVQDLDLTGREDLLLRLDARGALFLGCTLTAAAAERLRAGGALLFPRVPDVPFDPWRAFLYTPTELYYGVSGGYDHTPDALIHAWARSVAGLGSLRDLLAQALHDQSVDDALHEFVERRRIVGVMGGHALTRGATAYADAAHLGRDLAVAGLTVATGGGPGAMEAANLGARLAGHDSDTLDGVLAKIAATPGFDDDVAGWATAAIEATAGLSDSGRSLGIPTWHYGHEPPNAFSSRIAKYFRNAIREDILLEVSRGGIVFLPGAAGTVQEVFQAACTNYYSDAAGVVPMVFVGEEHWTRTLPVWPLVSALVSGRPAARSVHLVERTSEVLGLLVDE